MGGCRLDVVLEVGSVFEGRYQDLAVAEIEVESEYTTTNTHK